MIPRLLLRLLLLCTPRGLYLVYRARRARARDLGLDPRPSQTVGESMSQALRSGVLFCLALLLAALWSSPALVRLPGIIWSVSWNPALSFLQIVGIIWLQIVGITLGFLFHAAVCVLALLVFRLVVMELCIPQGLYYVFLRWPVESAMLPLGLIFISPCFLALLNAFKTNPEIISDPLALPEKLRWDNFEYIFTGMKLARPALGLRLLCAAGGTCLVTVAMMVWHVIVRRRSATAKQFRSFFLIGLGVSLLGLLVEYIFAGPRLYVRIVLAAVTIVVVCTVLVIHAVITDSVTAVWKLILRSALIGLAVAMPVVLVEFIYARMGADPMFNSLLMCAGVIVCLVTIAPMAAYSIMRRQMATGKILRVFFLVGLTVPFQIIMVPLLKLFRLMNIEFTYLALLLHYVSWGLPLCIFIYSAFMATIPRELEEAAAIDGCGQVATFWRIVFPLLTPCTVTIVIFWGLWIWNDFMQAFIIMGPTRGQLVFVQLWKFLNDQYVRNWNHIFAGVVVLSLPLTVLYIVMQRRFVKGLTAGAIK